MKRLRLSFLCAALSVIMLGSTVDAQAQIRIAPVLAYSFDATEIGIGASLFAGFSAGDYQLLANPSAEFYLFQKNVSLTRINLDVAYPIIAGDSFTPYVGAGVVVQRTSVDIAKEFQIPGIDYSDTDFGINVFVGSFFMDVESAIRPFARVNANLGAGTGVSVQAGASFAISK